MKQVLFSDSYMENRQSIASVTSIIRDFSKEMAILIITHDDERVGTRAVRITDINQ